MWRQGPNITILFHMIRKIVVFFNIQYISSVQLVYSSLKCKNNPSLKRCIPHIPTMFNTKEVEEVRPQRIHLCEMPL
jgi:hypothetical protein